MCKSIKEQSRDTGNIEHKSKNDDKQTNKQTNKPYTHNIKNLKRWIMN